MLPKYKNFEHKNDFVPKKAESSFAKFESLLVVLLFKMDDKRVKLSKFLFKWIKTHVWKFLLILLVFGVLLYGIGYAARQSIGNFESNKTQLIDKLKAILGQNDQEQLATLDKIEKAILKDLEPIGSVPVVGWFVNSDVKKVKTLAADWIEMIYPFANYKFGTNGFKTTLLQGGYFTDDLQTFFAKSPEMISKSRGVLNSFWLYKIFGSQNLRVLFETLQDILDIFDILTQNKEIVLRLFGHLQTQKVVIFNQNTGEARATGGFIGSYIPIDISKGEIKIGQSQSIYYFDRGINTNLVAHPATWNYNIFEKGYEVHGARNANFFPCFSTTASYLEREFSVTQNGYSIDDLIFITPQFLLGYLPDNFMLNINGEMIPKSQILTKIERITALEIEDVSNPKKSLTSIFNLLINQLPEILKGQALVNLITYTQQALYARDFQLWFRDIDTQKLWTTTGFSGEQTCADSNNKAIVPIVSNVSGDKRNLITSNNFTVQIDKGIVKVTYLQTIPDDAKDILLRGFVDNGFTMVGLQIPKNSKIKSIKSDQALAIPFLRDYYIQNIEQSSPQTIVIPPEIQKVINTSYDLKPDYKGGFSYLQPDNSEVIGIYVSDQYITKVEFEFEINDPKDLIFYGQPGLNNPSLSHKQQLDTDPAKIQTGVKIN